MVVAGNVQVKQIVEAMPVEWLGTTFRNSNLLGRGEFSTGLYKLMETKAAAEEAITTDDLTALGMAEDYLRVASNVSTTLEALVAQRKGVPAAQIISFSSTVMALVAVVLTAGGPVHCYTGEAVAPLSDLAMDVLNILTKNGDGALIGRGLEFHTGAPVAEAHAAETGAVVLRLDTVLVAAGDAAEAATVVDCDAIVTPSVLHVLNPDLVKPADVEVIRKRMCTPITSPVAVQMMTALADGAGLSGTFTPPSADDACPESDKGPLAEFYAHLQTMTGTTVDTAARPQCYTAGLPAICSLWMALSTNGGAELIMCSTAYGGSSQLTDLLCERSPATLRKHTFGIQGDADIVQALRSALEKVAALPVETEGAKKTTVLFIEVPTNPDMKVPDLDSLAEMIGNYCKDREGAMDNFLLLVDATFAPASKVMEQLHARLPELPVMTFISMSKSVSRGMTTAGALVANGSPIAIDLCAKAGEIGRALDTTYTLDQMKFLLDNHVGVEERCAKAHGVATSVGNTLCTAVKSCANGFDMRLNFVKPEHAAAGFTSSTFSFNLPRPEGASDDETEAVAQKFVDVLTTNAQFKPCVSFGQDNGLIYCTVPATSTQGAIKAEDKALQAVGGVQLVRLSFSPTMDVEAAQAHMQASVESLYARTESVTPPAAPPAVAETAAE